MGKNIEIGKIPSKEGLEILAKIVPHVDCILHDADYNKIKEKMKSNRNLTIADIMEDSFVVVAMKNRTALYGIVGAVTGKSQKEIEEQPLEDTLEVFSGVMGSKIIDFFIFCARMVVKM